MVGLPAPKTNSRLSFNGAFCAPDFLHPGIVTTLDNRIRRFIEKELIFYLVEKNMSCGDF